MNHDERIRATALDVAEQQLNATGKVALEDLADAADVSVVELRAQFPRADSLLTGLLERWLRRFDDAVDRELDVQDQAAGQWWMTRWRDELAADRVHPQRLTLVLMSVQGLAAAELMGSSAEALAELRREAGAALTALLSRPSAALAASDAGAETSDRTPRLARG